MSYDNQAGSAQAPATDKPKTEGPAYPRQAQGVIADTPPGPSRPSIADSAMTDPVIRKMADAAMQRRSGNSRV